ncbi:hypothetical protein [Paenibacillus herberti]|uniref:Uncharacterized protein n=1 Tax=Paenibacillus herberti TaxID=1619309 RepID=A0A229NWK8_9BACL|nr:hypothetical protein [Paenibacillus herberti]OXM14250.1 hypothetical protein CGZ75_14920 [Paenibacillus herberti]
MINNKMKILISSLFIMCLLAFGALLIFNYSITGILKKHGISKDEIRLTMEKTQFRFYLYEKKSGAKSQLGILTMHKEKDQLFWSFYNDSNLIDSGEREIVKTFFPTIENGILVSHSVWGGYLNKAVSKVNLRSTNGEIFSAELIFTAADGSTYFMHDLGNNDNQIEIAD